MSLAIIKDCGDIWNRLFDHRPFLSGEIKFFIKEFEESRTDREVDRLFETAEWLSEIRDTQIPKAKTSIPDLSKVNTLLEIALQTSSTILENEENFDVEEALKTKRAFRKTEWESFNSDLKEKYAIINKTFNEKEDDLVKFYEDLEKKLLSSKIAAAFKSAVEGKENVPPEIKKCCEEGVLAGLGELEWLHANRKGSPHLHELLSGCELRLPEPPEIPRNPELEARIKRLKAEQEEREYRNMTRNVDSVRVRHQDDNIGFQIRQINRQLIAVLQFVLSVIAGFMFGFLGLELIVGELEFGFRLLMGVICALIIALAEIYFLAKKLAEEEEFPNGPPPSSGPHPNSAPNPNQKQHAD